MFGVIKNLLRPRNELLRLKSTLTKLKNNGVHFLKHRSNRIALEIVLLYFLVVLFPILDLITPGWAIINNPGVIIELFSIISGSLAAILGIAIAFVIVTFEVNRRYFSLQYSAKKLFGSEALRILIALYSTTIAISILGLITYHSTELPYVTRTLYLVVGLYFLCIIMLVPLIKQLIAEEDIRKEIKKLITNITITDTHKIVPYRRFESIPHNLPLENPLVEIAETGRKALLAEDFPLAEYILRGITNQFFKLSEQVQAEVQDIESESWNGSASSLINGVSHVVSEIGNAALQKNNHRLVALSLNSFLDMITLYAEDGHKVDVVSGALDKFEKLLIKSIKLDMDEELRSVFFKIIRYSEIQLFKNLPLEKDLFEFNIDEAVKKQKEFSHTLSHQWRQMTEWPFKILEKAGNAYVDLQNEDMAGFILSRMNEIPNEAIKNERMGDGQKQRLLSYSFHQINKFFKLSVTKLNISNPWMFFLGMNMFTIEQHIDLEKKYSPFALQAMGDMFLLASRNGVLDTFTLNDLGSTGRALMKKINTNKLASMSIIFIADILGQIGMISSGNLSNHKQAQIYCESHRQLKSLARWYRHEKNVNRKVIRAINKQLKLFTELEIATMIVESENSDTWSRLFKKTK